MPYLTKEASQVLVSSLATCGGNRGLLFPVAKAIAEKKEGSLREIVQEILHPVAQGSIERLEAEAKDGMIEPESVLRRYGMPKHFHEMNTEAQLGMKSVAREIPSEYRAVAHTLLPLKDGVYSNAGHSINFRGLVPLGPQAGIQVAHLAGIFSCGCSDAEVEALLEEQSRDEEFLKAVSSVALLDYSGTQLQAATKRAKEILGL